MNALIDRVPGRGTTVALTAIGLAWLMVFLVHGYWAFKLATVLILALAVRGLQLLIGSSGQISLGHGAFFGLGAYAAGVLMSQGWLTPYLTVPAAALVCGVLGFLFGLPAVRLAGPYLALATFALSLAFPQLLKHPLFEGWTGGVSGLSLDPVTVPFGITWLHDDQWALLMTIVWVVIVYSALHRLVCGPTGLAWISLRDHPTAATAVGVDVRRWKAIAFGVSAATVGAAGALNTALTSFVSPDSFTVFLSLSLLVGVAISGPTSIVGTGVAAVFLSFAPDVMEKVSRELTGVLYGVVMLAIVFVVPALNQWRRHAALKRRADTAAPAPAPAPAPLAAAPEQAR